jgi:hypothetical protein
VFPRWEFVDSAELPARLKSEACSETNLSARLALRHVADAKLSDSAFERRCAPEKGGFLMQLL